MNFKFVEFIVADKGRGLQANKPLVLGELIGEEEPFAFAVGQKWRNSVCHQCLKIPSSLLRCSLCKFARYCSKVCQRKAWKDHKPECENLLKVAPKVPTETPRFVARILQKLRTEDSQLTKKQLDSLCYHGEMDDRSAQEFAELLQTVKTFVGDSFEWDHCFLTNLYQKIRCNSFSICNGEMQPIGVGLYLMFSLLNHSCQPNCVATFLGARVQIRAIQSIKKDEELTISYIEMLQTIAHRQKALQEQYHFLCGCLGCVSEEAVKQDKLHTSGNDETVTAKVVSDALEKCESLLQRANSAERDGDHKTSLQLAVRSFAMCSVIHPCSYCCIQCADRAMDSAIETGQWEIALRYGLETLEGYKLWYPLYHPSLAVQLFRVGKLQCCIDRQKDAIHSLDMALGVFEVSHGSDHPLTQDCKELLWQTRQEVAHT